MQNKLSSFFKMVRLSVEMDEVEDVFYTLCMLFKEFVLSLILSSM